MFKHGQKGYVAIFTILIVSFIGLATVLMVAYTGIDDLQTAFIYNKSAKALNYSDSCAEESLIRLRRDWESWSDSLEFENGSCEATVTVSTNATIDITSIHNDVTKTLQVEVDPDFNILTWQEN